MPVICWCWYTIAADLDLCIINCVNLKYIELKFHVLLDTFSQQISWHVGAEEIKLNTTIFTARRCALAQCVCPSLRPTVRLSVRPSVTSRYCIETTWRIELIVGIGLPSTDPTLCYKEIWVSPKIKVLPYWTLCQTPDLENFTTASQSRRQRNSSLSSSTVEFVDNACTTVESWLFTTSRSSYPLTPLLRFVVDLL